MTQNSVVSTAPPVKSESCWSETAKLDRFWLEFSPVIPGWEERRAMKVSKISDAQKAFISEAGF